MLNQWRFRAGKTLTAAIFLLVSIKVSAVYAQTPAPAPFGLVPKNDRQIEWYHREQQAFIHFGPNTFQNVEWGDGTANTNTFNPTDLDCNQWMRVLKAAGITTAILTIKHHDGFCLWPTLETEYCVRNSTWKDGKGDVLKEFTDACRAAGIKAGIYLSPWDRHEEQPGALHKMGTPAYVDYYCRQIVELCKNKPYGPFYEIWQDGAGDINALTEADYKKWTDTLHKYMPECVVWATKRSVGVGDIHWVGNEGGTAGDPCWSTVNTADVLAENGKPGTGDPDGDVYMPAETNTSIRPGWFYHSTEQPKSVGDLWNLYFTSVARNTVLLLNFPPDKRGWLPAADSTSGAGMGSYIYGTFRQNLLAGATATALHGRGDPFTPDKMVDNCENTCFASADANKTDTIVFTPAGAITFDCIMLQEVIELGHRTLSWSVDAYSNNTWTTITAANNKQCIGYKRAVKWSPATTATQVRLRITNGRACPAIHTFGVYKQAQVDPPSDWNGLGPVVKCPVTSVLPSKKATERVTLRTLQFAGEKLVVPVDFATGPLAVTILDLQGQVVRHTVTHADGSSIPMHLSSLNAGTYLVKCSNGVRTLERKLVKVRGGR